MDTSQELPGGAPCYLGMISRSNVCKLEVLARIVNNQASFSTDSKKMIWCRHWTCLNMRSLWLIWAKLWFSVHCPLSIEHLEDIETTIRSKSSHWTITKLSEGDKFQSFSHLCFLFWLEISMQVFFFLLAVLFQASHLVILAFDKSLDVIKYALAFFLNLILLHELLNFTCVYTVTILRYFAIQIPWCVNFIKTTLPPICIQQKSVVLTILFTLC